MKSKKCEHGTFNCNTNLQSSLRAILSVTSFVRSFLSELQFSPTGCFANESGASPILRRAPPTRTLISDKGDMTWRLRRCEIPPSSTRHGHAFTHFPPAPRHHSHPERGDSTEGEPDTVKTQCLKGDKRRETTGIKRVSSKPTKDGKRLRDTGTEVLKQRGE